MSDLHSVTLRDRCFISLDVISTTHGVREAFPAGKYNIFPPCQLTGMLLEQKIPEEKCCKTGGGLCPVLLTVDHLRFYSEVYRHGCSSALTNLVPVLILKGKLQHFLMESVRIPQSYKCLVGVSIWSDRAINPLSEFHRRDTRSLAFVPDRPLPTVVCLSLRLGKVWRIR